MSIVTSYPKLQRTPLTIDALRIVDMNNMCIKQKADNNSVHK